jgi:ABC-type sugar transport system substrate-binding protein
VKKIRVLLSLARENNDYQRLQASIAEQTAARMDVELTIISAKGDSIKQSQDLLDVIQTSSLRPDAIVVEPAGTTMANVAKAAVVSGIGWVMLNRRAEYMAELRDKHRVPLFGISSDNEQIGRLQGQQLGVLLPQGGSALYIQGLANATSEARLAGLSMTMPKNIELRMLRGDWTPEGGQKAISAWLRLSTSKGDRIGVVACQNDDMAMGARRALEQNGQLLGVPFIGVDGVPTAGQTWVRGGALTATIIAPPHSGLAIEVLVQALRTGVNPREYTLVSPESHPSLIDLQPKAGKVHQGVK